MPKSLSKTPAPKKDRIFGSDKNKVGSASSKASAKGIELSESILATLSQKAKDYNESHPKNKVSVATLKAVMRRGMGAYSTSHRPTITGGAPNSRQAWGFARVNKFLKKKAGQQVKAAYVQDDDLMEKGGFIAPNGKTSNLTPEQYKLVRTPEFKSWFGDWENDPENASKVVDENGEPLVVYHGGINSINFFNSELNYFSPHRYISEDFANYKYGEKGKVFEVFLNIKNPKNFDAIYSDLLEIEAKKGFDGFIAKAVVLNDGSNEGKQFVAFEPNQIKLADGTNKSFDMNNPDIRYADGGTAGEDITCINCGWHWNTSDSDESDKYICHKCGFDNRTFYDPEPIGEYHLGGDMSKHLAPNGKPSNLNHEQWHLVRTPEFKSWFGDWENDPENASKVVDENGEPLVVYHGTKNEFSIFDLDKVGTKTDTGMWGKGFYFSSNKKYSETYASSTGYVFDLSLIHI
jgi:hypothetical protein